MKVKLNIQSIRVAERIMKKPFSKFDLSDDETLMILLYGMVSENNEETFTVDSFKKIFEMKKVRLDILKQFSNELAYMDQFKEEGSGGQDDMYMGELAAFLIRSGMDAHFVLYEMKLFEIGDYIKAIDDDKKDKMESDRFWTYLRILPHVDGKKLKSPESLISFPWESESKAKSKEAEIEQGIKMFNKFFNSSKP